MSQGDELVPKPVSHAPAPKPLKPAPKHPARPVFPIVMGVLVLGTLIASWVLTGGGLGQPAEAAPAPAAAAVAPEAPPEPPAPATLADLTAVKGEVEGVAKKLDELQEKLDAIPKPDLAPITTGLDKLSGEVAPLATQVKALGGRLDATGKALDGLKSDVNALKEEVEKAKKAPPATVPSTPPPAGRPAASPEKPKLSGDEMKAALDLYTQGRYPQAAAEFRKLGEQNPEDARVFYYAALATGYATRAWEGPEVQGLVSKAVDLEKAGTPDSAAIDAALSSLTEATGARWVEFYRRKAKP